MTINHADDESSSSSRPSSFPNSGGSYWLDLARASRSVIPLRFSIIEWTDYGCLTTFADGASVGAHPHWEDAHYSVIAHRCGYADDLLSYCREHEFVHSFISERICGHYSPVLWLLAHGSEVPIEVSAYEEALVQMFQAWLRANQEPIIGGVNWLALKAEALTLLESAG